MKSKISPNVISKFYRRFATALISLCLLALISNQTIFAQQSQLSLVDVVTVLRSKKVSLEDRNKLLTEGVSVRGVTFSLNAEIEKELRSAGANESLIKAILVKMPVAKPSPTPQPKVEPSPTPAATTAPTPKKLSFSDYQNQGNSSFVMGEFDKAVANYNRAIEINSKDPNIYLSRGLAHFNRKDYGFAIADYDKVIELNPQEAVAYFNRANALEKTNNVEKAMVDFKKTLELDGENESAKFSLKRLQTQLEQEKIAQQNAQLESEKEKAAQQNAKIAENTAVKAQNTENSKQAFNIQKTVPQNSGLQNSFTGNETKISEPKSTSEKSVEKSVEKVEKSAEKDINGDISNVGNLNNYVKRLEIPAYPVRERQQLVEGLVIVEVTIDEEGKLVSAKGISGQKGLRISAESAVRKSTFNPYLIGGKPVKVTGYIQFNFKLK